MSTVFFSYLFCILFIIFIVAVIVFFIKSRQKTGNVALSKLDEIKGGNVSVFFDRDRNVTVIPYIKDKFGTGKALAEVQFLRSPYTRKGLGDIIRRSMELCRTGTPCTGMELMRKLNFNDWKEFTVGKKSISVYYSEKHGVILNATSRSRDGAYRLNGKGYERIVPTDIEDEELAVELLDVAKWCRC